MSASFEWDPAKDADNQRKHGVSFVEARAAFLDPGRVIARDVGHSRAEPALLLLRSRLRWDSDGPFHVSRQCHSNHWRRTLAQGQKAV